MGHLLRLCECGLVHEGFLRWYQPSGVGQISKPTRQKAFCRVGLLNTSPPEIVPGCVFSSHPKAEKSRPPRSPLSTWLHSICHPLNKQEAFDFVANMLLSVRNCDAEELCQHEKTVTRSIVKACPMLSLNGKMTLVSVKSSMLSIPTSNITHQKHVSNLKRLRWQ